MIVHDEGESDAGSTPCKDSTLIVRQVEPPSPGGTNPRPRPRPNLHGTCHSTVPLCSSAPLFFFCFVFFITILFPRDHQLCSVVVRCRAEKPSASLSLTKNTNPDASPTSPPSFLLCRRQRQRLKRLTRLLSPPVE